MAAVREVRAFFEERRAAAGEPADSHARGEYLLNSYLLNSPEVEQAFAALPRSVRATFVRFTLEELATLAPGNSVEVRVPPLGVTQCVAGPRHTRGTPPSVVETRPLVWAALVLGACSWRWVPVRLTLQGSAVTFRACCRSSRTCYEPAGLRQFS